jgi:hypothetical protein
MKRLSAILLALAAGAVMMIPASASAASCGDLAYCAAWPGTGCILVASDPYPVENILYIEGTVSCSAPHTFSLEASVQVHNANGNWYQISGSTIYGENTTYLVNDWAYTGGVAGHLYRTWAQGCLGSSTCQVLNVYSGGVTMP